MVGLSQLRSGLVALGMTGVASTLCLRPGRKKSTVEIDSDADSDALMPLQPLSTKGSNAAEVIPASSDAA